MAQAGSVRVAARRHREDRGADLGDRGVERGHLLLDAGRGGGIHRTGNRLEAQARPEEALDDVIVQVARDPPPVFEHGEALRVGLGGGERKRDGGLCGEFGGHDELGFGEAREPRTTEYREGAHPLVGAREGHRHGGPEAGNLEARVVGEHGLAALDRTPGNGVCRLEEQAVRVGGERAARQLDAQQTITDGGDHGDEVCLGEVDNAFGEGGEGVIRLLGEQDRGHLGARFGPALAPAGLLVETGMLDRGSRGCGKGGDELLVFGGEGSAVAVGEVQVAVHLVADAHRNSEEAVHRGVIRRESARAGVGGEVLEPDR